MVNTKQIKAAVICGLMVASMSVVPAFAETPTDISKIQSDGSIIVTPGRDPGREFGRNPCDACGREHMGPMEPAAPRAVIIEWIGNTMKRTILDTRECMRDAVDYYYACRPAVESKRLSEQSEDGMSGWFISDTGTTLNVYVEWEAKKKDKNVELTFDIYLRHGTLFAVENPEGLVLKVGDEETVLESPVFKFVTDKLENTLLAHKTVTVKDGVDKKIPVNVSWEFNGTYSKKDIDTIKCSETILVK